jgi:hypothetical protein
VRERLTKTYHWEIPDRPPLQLVCAGQGGLSMPSFTACLADPGLMFDHQLDQAEQAREIGSDSIPILVPVPNSAVLVPSMYGSRIEELESVWAHPLEGTLGEIVDGLQSPPLDAGLMPDYERCARYFRDRAPDWAHVCSPIPHEALESALYLRGQDLFIEMLDQPERMHALFGALTETHVQTILRLKEILGEPSDRMVSHKGTYMPATRLACDAVVNLSPQLIGTFFVPYLRRLATQIGTRIHLHWCSIATNPARHVPGALEEARNFLSGIATHHHCFGDSNDPVYIQRALGGRFAMTLDLPRRAPVDAFREWAADLAARWENPTGVLIRTVVRSVDEGRAYMDIWRAAWNGRLS